MASQQGLISASPFCIQKELCEEPLPMEVRGAMGAPCPRQEAAWPPLFCPYPSVGSIEQQTDGPWNSEPAQRGSSLREQGTNIYCVKLYKCKGLLVANSRSHIWQMKVLNLSPCLPPSPVLFPLCSGRPCTWTSNLTMSHGLV